MADRVHPSDDAAPKAEPSSDGAEKTDHQAQEDKPNKPIPSFVPKPKPAPGTYVVQIPKDQIYRVPPPQNDRLFHRYSHRKPRRGRCRRCCCWVFFLTFFLLLAAAILSAAFYFAARPRAPRYSVDSVSVRGFNLTTARPISPEFVIGVRAENPNKAIGIYYRAGSSVTASYDGVELVNGALPAFYQGTKNVTTFKTVLKGSELLLADDVHGALTAAQRRGIIPLTLDVRAPVRVRAWGVRSWTIEVKVRCEVGLNKLAQDSNVISTKCRVKVNPFP